MASYTKTTWTTGDIITQTKARNWEDGIENAHNGSSDAYSWSTGVGWYIDDWVGNTNYYVSPDWVAEGGGTVEVDQTNYKVGTHGIRINTAANGGGADVALTQDMSVLGNGESVATSDYWVIAIYIETAEIAKMAADSYLRLDLRVDGSNYYRYNGIEDGDLSNGWNYFAILRSDFTTVGSPTWAGITTAYHVYQSAGATSPTSEMWWTIDYNYFGWVKKDPSTAEYNPFQRAGAADYTINSGTWYVGWDDAYNAYIVNDIEGAALDEDSLIGTKAYSDEFYFSVSGIISDNTQTNDFGWYKSATQDITIKLTSSTNFRLTVEDTGVTNYDVTIPTVSAGDKYVMKLNRLSATKVVAIIIVNGKSYSTSATIAITGDGYAHIATRGSILNNVVFNLGITTTNYSLQSGESATTKDISSRITGSNYDRQLGMLEGAGLSKKLLRHFYDTIVVLGSDPNSTTWANKAWGNADSGVYSADTSNNIWWDQAAKCTGTADGDGIHAVNSVDFSANFTSNDYVYMPIWVEDTTKLNTGLTLIVANDAFGTLTDYFSYDIAKGALSNGNNYLQIAKSAFTSNNSPDWASVTGFSLAFDGAPSASTSFAVHIIQLVRVDPQDNTQPNYFQNQIGNGVWENYITWAGTEESILGLENDVVKWKLLGTNDDTNAYLINKNYSSGANFEMNTEITLDVANQTSRLVFYIDDDNYIMFLLDGVTAFWRKRVNGSTTTNTDSITTVKGDIIKVVIIKTAINWNLNLTRNGNSIDGLVLEDLQADFSNKNGQIGFGGASANPCYIESVQVDTVGFCNHANTSNNTDNVGILTKDDVELFSLLRR